MTPARDTSVHEPRTGEIHFRRNAPKRAFQKQNAPVRIDEQRKALKAGFDEGHPDPAQKTTASACPLRNARNSAASAGGMIVALIGRLWR